MFSGLVESKTTVLAVTPEPGGVRLTLQRPASFADIAIGDSIATQGCCLTVIEKCEASMVFQAGEETLARTGLGKLQKGDFVNCERSLKLGDRLGGHWVTGHIDGQATVVARQDNNEWSDFVFEAPRVLTRQMASKGSVTVDGVSLTLVEVTSTTFSVALIPHTLSHTTLGELQLGSQVNIETDLLAKYVQRQLETGSL
jgi:riboflavin synthase